MTTVDKPTAADLMTQNVVTVSIDDTLQNVVQTLIDADVSNAPVVREHAGKRILLGLITEKDCINCFGDEKFYTDPSTQINHIVRYHPVCVKPETELMTLASIFMQHGFRHLPVLQDEELLGIVSRRDVLRALQDNYKEQIAHGKVHRVIPDYTDIRNAKYLII